MSPDLVGQASEHHSETGQIGISEDRESHKSQSESLVLLASTILPCLLSPLHLSANASTVGEDRLFIGLIPTGTILAALGLQDDHDCQ